MKNNPKKKRIVNVHTKLALQLNEKYKSAQDTNITTT